MKILCVLSQWMGCPCGGNVNEFFENSEFFSPKIMIFPKFDFFSKLSFSWTALRHMILMLANDSYDVFDCLEYLQVIYRSERQENEFFQRHEFLSQNGSDFFQKLIHFVVLRKRPGLLNSKYLVNKNANALFIQLFWDFWD